MVSSIGSGTKEGASRQHRHAWLHGGGAPCAPLELASGLASGSVHCLRSLTFLPGAVLFVDSYMEGYSRIVQRVLKGYWPVYVYNDVSPALG